MKLFLALLFVSSVCFASDFPETYLEFSPELSYGVHDNGPAWIEMVPLRGGYQITKDTMVKAGFSYAYEIDRDKKPFGPPNHYGWRLCAKLEHRLSGDVNFFYEVNVADKTDGAKNDINYLQMTNYQRVGIIWRLLKIF